MFDVLLSIASICPPFSFRAADTMLLAPSSAPRNNDLCGNWHCDEFEECDIYGGNACCQNCRLTPGSTCYASNGISDCCHDCRHQPAVLASSSQGQCYLTFLGQIDACATTISYNTKTCRGPTLEDPCRVLCRDEFTGVCGDIDVKISDALCIINGADGICVYGACEPIRYKWLAWKPRCTCPEDKDILTERKVACVIKTRDARTHVVSSSYCNPELRPPSHEACCLPSDPPVGTIVGAVLAAVFVLVVLLIICCMRKHRTCCWAPVPTPSPAVEMTSHVSTDSPPCAASAATQRTSAVAPQHSHTHTSAAVAASSSTYVALPSPSSSLASASAPPMASLSLAAAAYGAPPLTVACAPAQPPSYARVCPSSHSPAKAPSQQPSRSLEDAPELPPSYSSLWARSGNQHLFQ